MTLVYLCLLKVLNRLKECGSWVSLTDQYIFITIINEIVKTMPKKYVVFKISPSYLIFKLDYKNKLFLGSKTKLNLKNL